MDSLRLLVTSAGCLLVGLLFLFAGEAIWDRPKIGRGRWWLFFFRPVGPRWRLWPRRFDRPITALLGIALLLLSAVFFVQAVAAAMAQSFRH